MYYPYFRGKQFDLIAVRESAELLAQSKFTPIIEPVKETFSGLIRTIDDVNNVGGELVLIVNPENGDLAGNPDAIASLLDSNYKDCKNIAAGIFATENTSIEEINQLCDKNADRPVAIIHAGFAEGRALRANLDERPREYTHIFFEEDSGKLYRKHFYNHPRVLLRDGFQRRANRLHPPVEFFSDLHATFADEGMDGFGDFLIVGEEYSEVGGPAYAIAIHLTFIDSEKDDEMHICHFKSDRFDTPTDPAGKFAEAVKKLAGAVVAENSKILRTRAVEEFLDFNRSGHFPGLGYVKKLSMQHHIEVLASYFDGNI
jgi:hypothetical protein